MSLVDRLQRVREEVREAALQAGRSPSDVTLIAVSKTFPPSAILQAYEAGQRHFGESYPQELRDKAPELPSDIVWHFLGRLQRNKAKYVAPIAARVHAIDSVRTVQALASRAPRPVATLISVNTGLEEQKGGVRPAAALALARELHRLEGCELKGLMCIPPRDEAASPHFERLAELAEEGRREGLPLHELSMGMSSDFREAIALGATWIRVGTAIFGSRG